MLSPHPQGRPSPVLAFSCQYSLSWSLNNFISLEKLFFGGKDCIFFGGISLFFHCVCVCVVCLLAQSCVTLCDPMDCSQPGTYVHGILQAIILERVSISFSRGTSWPRDWTCVSCIAGRFFTCWAFREVHCFKGLAQKGEIWGGLTNKGNLHPTVKVLLAQNTRKS